MNVLTTFIDRTRIINKHPILRRLGLKAGIHNFRCKLYAKQICNTKLQNTEIPVIRKKEKVLPFYPYYDHGQVALGLLRCRNTGQWLDDNYHAVNKRNRLNYDYAMEELDQEIETEMQIADQTLVKF